MSNGQDKSSSPRFEAGAYLPGGHNTDPPLPEHSPTVGYKLNHCMVRIRDPQRSLHFYIDFMGMRSVFTMNCGPFTIYYLGYPSTSEDRADLPTWASKVASPQNLMQTPGLLELYHIHGTERSTADGGYEMSTGNVPPNLGFGHLGFTVPDVPAAVERLKNAGVPILKGVEPISREHVPLTEWEENRGVGVGEIHPDCRVMFDQLAFVTDPDGYMVELLPQNMQ